MESPLSFFRMHWDHEPSDRAVASRTAPVLWRFWLARLHCQNAGGLAHLQNLAGLRRLLPSWEGSGVGRFMESVAVGTKAQCEAEYGCASPLQRRRSSRARALAPAQIRGKSS